MAWSRVDYLLRADPPTAPAFRMHLEEPVLQAKALPTHQELVERQFTALRRALDLDMTGFDQAWCEWVLREYARR